MADFTKESCIWAPDASTAYSNLLRNALMWGEECSPRGMTSKEIRPVMFRIDGDQRWVGQPTRKLSTKLGILEGLQLIGGFSVPIALMAVAPQYVKFVNPADGSLDGAYGPRVIAQIPYIVRILNQDSDTRQAVATIYGPQDHHTSLDVPCTLSLQFFLRDNPAARYPNGFEFDKFCPLHGRSGSGAGPCICNRWWRCANADCGEVTWGAFCSMCATGCPTDIYAERFDSLPNPYFEEEGGPPPEKALEIVVTMRSNDIWLGVPYDVVQFSMLQAAVAGELKVAVGRYTHISGSMHLYKRDWKRAEALIKDTESRPPTPPPMGRMPYNMSTHEAYAAMAQWWVGRAKKQVEGGEQVGVDPSMIEMISDQQTASPKLSPFYQWCLEELKKEDGNG